MSSIVETSEDARPQWETGVAYKGPATVHPSATQILLPLFDHVYVETTGSNPYDAGMYTTMAGERVPAPEPQKEAHQLPLFVQSPSANGSSESPITEPLVLRSLGNSPKAADAVRGWATRAYWDAYHQEVRALHERSGTGGIAPQDYARHVAMIDKRFGIPRQNGEIDGHVEIGSLGITDVRTRIGLARQEDVDRQTQLDQWRARYLAGSPGNQRFSLEEAGVDRSAMNHLDKVEAKQVEEKIRSDVLYSARISAPGEPPMYAYHGDVDPVHGSRAVAEVFAQPEKRARKELPRSARLAQAGMPYLATAKRVEEFGDEIASHLPPWAKPAIKATAKVVGWGTGAALAAACGGLLPSQPTSETPFPPGATILSPTGTPSAEIGPAMNILDLTAGGRALADALPKQGIVPLCTDDTADVQAFLNRTGEGAEVQLDGLSTATLRALESVKPEGVVSLTCDISPGGAVTWYLGTSDGNILVPTADGQTLLPAEKGADGTVTAVVPEQTDATRAPVFAAPEYVGPSGGGIVVPQEEVDKEDAALDALLRNPVVSTASNPGSWETGVAWHGWGDGFLWQSGLITEDGSRALWILYEDGVYAAGPMVRPIEPGEPLFDEFPWHLEELTLPEGVEGKIIMAFSQNPDVENATYLIVSPGGEEAIAWFNPELRDWVYYPGKEPIPDTWTATFVSDDSLRANLSPTDAEELVAIGAFTIRPPASEADQGYGVVPIAVVGGPRLVAVSPDGMATKVDTNLAWIVDGSNGQKQLLELIPRFNDQGELAWYHPNMPERPLYLMQDGQLLLVMSQDNTMDNARLVTVAMDQKFQLEETQFSKDVMVDILTSFSSDNLTNSAEMIFSTEIGESIIMSYEAVTSRDSLFSEFQLSESNIHSMLMYLMGRLGLRKMESGDTINYPEYSNKSVQSFLKADISPGLLVEIAKQRLAEGRVYTTDIFLQERGPYIYQKENGGIPPDQLFRNLVVGRLSREEFQAFKSAFQNSPHLFIHHPSMSFTLEGEQVVINENDMEYLLYYYEGTVILLYHQDIEGLKSFWKKTFDQAQNDSSVRAQLIVGWGFSQVFEPFDGSGKTTFGWDQATQLVAGASLKPSDSYFDN